VTKIAQSTHREVGIHGISDNHVANGRETKALHAISKCGPYPSCFMRNSQAENKNAHWANDSRDSNSFLGPTKLVTITHNLLLGVGAYQEDDTRAHGDHGFCESCGWQ
jgi:hypothetical protein